MFIRKIMTAGRRTISTKVGKMPCVGIGSKMS